MMYLPSIAATAAAVALALLQVEVATAQSADTVVFVHGLGGWHEDEFLGFPYWTYKEDVEKAGFTGIITNVGKFTSNWDRACELYAQLKGTVVDYGVCHSRETGHARFGQDFTGVAKYPDWSAEKKVHMIGHSMGGQTMLMIERLLREGSGCAEDTSELFTGGNKNWIQSITSISGTLDGTTFMDDLDPAIDFITDLVVALAGLIDNGPIDNVYSIDFAQWGLEEAPGENIFEFIQRAKDNQIFSPDNKDISTYDLTEAGARELNNARQQAYPDTYYFAIATERTHTTRDCFLFLCGDPYETPDLGMIIFLKPSAAIIGQTASRAKQANDGLVNRWNQICPTNDASGKSSCREYTGSWTPGVWHYLDVPTLDHLQVILPNTLTDIFNYDAGPKKVYTDIGTRLAAISSGNLRADVEEKEVDEVDPNLARIAYLGKEPTEVRDEFKPNKSLAIGVVALSAMAVLGVVMVTIRQLYKVAKKNGAEEIIAEQTRSSVKLSNVEVALPDEVVIDNTKSYEEASL